MQRKPKLIFLVTEDWFFVSHRLPLGIAAKEAGYDVIVATRAGDAASKIRAQGLRVAEIPFHRSGLNPLSELRTIREIARLYRAERPDVVHHVAVKPVVLGAVAARLSGIGTVVNALTGLGYVFSSRSAKARLLKGGVRSLLKSALTGPRNTRLIVQNGDDRAFFVDNSLVRPEDVTMIRGSGVDPHAFPPGDARGVGSPPLVVLPARMLRDKGVIEFIEAARLIKARGLGARFALCGAPDPLNPASLTESEIEGYVREGVVEYWGWQSDMAPVWQKAQIVCLPSYREGLPRALLEAAASRLPIVATDVPGCREICRDGVNGWLVPARDSGALAAALEAAITREDLRVAYGEAGRKIVEKELSLDYVIKSTLAVYDSLLARGRALAGGHS